MRVPAIAVAPALMALVVAAAEPAAAQVVTVPSVEALETRTAAPQLLNQRALSLADAVELTIRENQDISRAAQRLRAATGRRRQLGGPFDYVIRSSPNVTISYQQLTPFLRGREISTRETIKIIADQYNNLTAILQSIIDGTSTVPPRCPSNLTFDRDRLSLDRVDETTQRLIGVEASLPAATLINLEGFPTRGILTEDGPLLGIDLGDICSTPIEPFFSPEAFNGALRKIDQGGGFGLESLLIGVAQIPKEVRLLQQQITRAVAVRAELALERLGEVPDDDIKRNFIADVALSKAFRNGVSFDAAFEVQSQEHHFVGKPLDPSFGGLGVPTQFYSSASLTLNVPLLRGLGRAATGAPERASEYIERAEQNQLRHAVTESVFRTVLAYLNLVAAQDTVRLLDESSARQDRILALTRQRVASGDVAGVEVSRVQARVASVASALARARAAVDDARVALAESMGVRVESLAALPTAGDGFSTATVDMAEAVTLVEQALGARHDARAARERREAAAVLAEGARLGERRQLDLSFSAGLSNLYDSPFFRYLWDEQAPIIQQTATLPIAELVGVPVPPDSPLRYSSPRGFGRVLSARHEPFVSVNVTWQLPFGNRAAKGRSAQAAATLETSSINERDLERVIAENVIGTTGTVRQASDAAAGWQSAVDFGEQVLSAALNQLQTGDLTILDTLLTEQSVTEDQLQLVRQRQIYLSTLARLRFDTAQLVVFENPGTPTEQIRFNAADFTGR
ncbi:MAG TPA: TolC family protein [Vicinamibacterales bacterium]|nr:TolC family protein [Vicinamibacterales bacterium]